MPGFCLVRSEEASPPPPAPSSPQESCRFLCPWYTFLSPVIDQQGVLDTSLATGKVDVIFLIGRIQFGGLWSPGVSFPGWGSGELDRHRKEWLPPFFLYTVSCKPLEVWVVGLRLK